MKQRQEEVGTAQYIQADVSILGDSLLCKNI